MSGRECAVLKSGESKSLGYITKHCVAQVPIFDEAFMGVGGISRTSFMTLVVGSLTLLYLEPTESQNHPADPFLDLQK